MSRNLLNMLPILGGDAYLGGDEVELLGEDPLDALAAAFDEDDEDDDEPMNALNMGLDEILGAVRKAKAKRVRRFNVPARAKALAALKSANAYAVVKKQAQKACPEITPIPLTALLAGATVQLPVTPVRTFRPDRLEFASSFADHSFVAVMMVAISGIEIFNGGGGVLCSQLSELRRDLTLRSRVTAQANVPITITLTNRDVVNARSVTGLISGPAAQ
jgi:hypothetical protein